MYDILVQIIDAPAGADPAIIDAAIVLITLFVVWFLDSLIKLFRFRL